MKKHHKILLGVMCLIFILSFGCERTYLYTDKDIKLAARRASVQPVFYIPAMKVFFTTPLDEEKEFTKEDIEELLKEKIKEAIEKDREEQAEEKYSSYFTEIDEWGYEPVSQTHVPLGALAPKWAKFPERVLVVCKVEKKEITAWEKEYEKDILAISETANVSPSQAKGIINRLRAEGYSVSKEEVAQSETVELLHFSNGWDDKYPTILKWSVEVLGSEVNLIVGYDSKGILEIQPVPDDVRLHVVAGYFDLKDEYKPKSDEVKKLESQVEMLEEDVKDKQIIIDEQKKEEDKKRDISTATLGDLMYGNVKVDNFWFMSAASGVFLGNMRVTDKFFGVQSNWGSYKHIIINEKKGVVLTNAHVAEMALNFEIYVSEDKEEMWVIFPGIPYIRYTKDTDLLGSPAQVLWVENEPVSSQDFDSAIMVTTAIPSYEKHKAILGDSDKVKEGDAVIMVGNPGYMQKFLTEGVIANKSYSFLDSFLGSTFLGFDLSLGLHRWLLNSNFWFDTPIGIGGTSGSGVWALEGSEKGKVIALHNMGLKEPLSIASAVSDEKNIDSCPLIPVASDTPLKSVLREYKSEFFKDYPFKEAKFKFNVDSFAKEEPLFKEAMEHCGLWVDVAGMNAGVPINKVKQYLQERGIDPANFGWEKLSDGYWEN